MYIEESIARITNIAQEKNTNWLGMTNIEAMQDVLEELKADKIKIKLIENSLEKLKVYNNEISLLLQYMLQICTQKEISKEEIKDIKLELGKDFSYKLLINNDKIEFKL